MRREVFGLDGSQYETVPYVVQENNYQVELFQPRSFNRHAVFFVRQQESLQAYYERKRDLTSASLKEDPQISHDMLLETDIFGNPLVSLSIAYGHQGDCFGPHLNEKDRKKQKQSHFLVWTSSYMNLI